MNFQTDEIDINYIINSGLLFEINHSLLHLFGISLTVLVDEQGRKSWGFKDSRAAPEDAHFAPEIFKEGQKKFNKFLEKFGREQMNRRAYCMGSSCQSFPEYEQKRGFNGKRM